MHLDSIPIGNAPSAHGHRQGNHVGRIGTAYLRRRGERTGSAVDLVEGHWGRRRCHTVLEALRE